MYDARLEKYNAPDPNAVDTYWATIYAGFRVGRTGATDFRLHSKADALRIIHEDIDANGLCVTVTETEFHYTNGWEPGVIVGLINYPRFPKPDGETRDRAMALARRLLVGLEQQRVTVVFPGETFMLNAEGVQP